MKVDAAPRMLCAGVPDDIEFKTNPEIALDQIRWAREAGLPRGVALMDVAYGGCGRA
jgi:SRSO17 transposase